MATIAILLDKPIPPEGRKPTSRECKRFRQYNTNIRPTTSGAWMLTWYKGKPYIDLRDRKTKTVCGWIFQILEPEQPTTPARPSLPATSLSNSDAVHAEPTMCW